VAHDLRSCVQPKVEHVAWRFVRLHAWNEGALFRSVSRHGKLGKRLGARDVARIVQKLAAATGLDATLYSGHSLRSGLATSAARAGQSDRSIMSQGGADARWSIGTSETRNYSTRRTRRRGSGSSGRRRPSRGFGRPTGCCVLDLPHQRLVVCRAGKGVDRGAS